MRNLMMIFGAFVSIFFAPKSTRGDVIEIETDRAYADGTFIRASTDDFTMRIDGSPYQINGAYLVIHNLRIEPGDGGDGLVMIDGTRYGQGFVVFGETNFKLSGDTGIAGLALLDPFTSLGGCYVVEIAAGSIGAASVRIRMVDDAAGCDSPLMFAPGDFTRDGEVSVADLFAFVDAWCRDSTIADLDRSGLCDIGDVFYFLDVYLTS